MRHLVVWRPRTVAARKRETATIYCKAHTYCTTTGYDQQVCAEVVRPDRRKRWCGVLLMVEHASVHGNVCRHVCAHASTTGQHYQYSFSAKGHGSNACCVKDASARGGHALKAKEESGARHETRLSNICSGSLTSLHWPSAFRNTLSLPPHRVSQVCAPPYL